MALSDIFSSEPAQQAAQEKIAGFAKGREQAQTRLAKGSKDQLAYYGNALVPYETLFGTGMGGMNAYADALGMNGAEGRARALEQFRSSPGYDFTLSQGLQATNRAASRNGSYLDPSTDLALMQYGQGLADKTYDSYMNRFSPFFALAGTGAQGAGAVNMGAGNAAYNFGKDGAAYDWAAETGIGDANAAASMADYAASKNVWDMGTNVMKTLFSGGNDTVASNFTNFGKMLMGMK